VKLDIMRTEILKRGCSYSPSPVEAAGITPSPLLNTMSFEQLNTCLNPSREAHNSHKHAFCHWSARIVT